MSDQTSVLPIPVVLFSKSKDLPDAYPQIVKSFSTVIKDAELYESTNLDSFLGLIKSGSPAILIYHVADREELLSIMNFLPTVRMALKDRRAVVSIFAKTTSPKVEEALLRSGCTEILHFDISAKAFLYKLKRYLLFLKMERAGDVRSVEVKGQQKSKEPSPDVFLERSMVSQKNAVEVHGQVVLADPLKTKLDYWLIRKVPYVHRYKGQWMVELIGPSPAAGKWRLTTKHNALFHGEDMIWEFGLRDQPGKFGPSFNAAPAAWVFTGKKPEYNWMLHRWVFLSMNPGLHLVENGKVLETRFFENDQGLLNMAKNSRRADEVFDRIKDTFDQDYFLELERIETNGVMTEVDAGPSVPWADRLSSKKIPPSAWKNHDLNQQEGPEWGNDLAESDDEIQTGGLPGESSVEIEIPLGANAMRESGIRASIDEVEVELMSYSEDQPTLVIGTDLKLKVKDEIEIHITSLNMNGGDLNFTVRGSVLQVEMDDQERSIATITLLPEFVRKLGKLKFVVAKRQEEILEFFKRAKGIG
jgi:hypothetical protein